MNENRQAKILEIIKKHKVKTQGELRDWLYKEGFDVTQATISRDIRQLSLVKELSGGDYVYTAHPRAKGAEPGNSAPLYKNSVVSVESAGNMLCIKCPSGMANAACVTIDAYYSDRMVGSIAGDDTIFILCSTQENANAFKAELEKLFNVKNT
ncbi:MAG: arginine repressor [Clostridiales bacterium]|nr:arginine repressor [Clostridiales bacterium]